MGPIQLQGLRSGSRRSLLEEKYEAQIGRRRLQNGRVTGLLRQATWAVRGAKAFAGSRDPSRKGSEILVAAADNRTGPLDQKQCRIFEKMAKFLQVLGAEGAVDDAVIAA